MAYGARLESVLSESSQGFESPILRHVMSRDICLICRETSVIYGAICLVLLRWPAHTSRRPAASPSPASFIYPARGAGAAGSTSMTAPVSTCSRLMPTVLMRNFQVITAPSSDVATSTVNSTP